ncbi:sensor histidine kinase [Paenibacillus tyrfis]|uniref:histidine kinase n=1 Tax=Paenibacillus tyrfis TaxID=1501230 RepID=A0A081P6X3_9BACL|nr:ATP-binding protein [Paenibacillus tyrfis]KEQ26446.1 histidine kinase [Paenibacillus tyrfis]
MSKKEKIKPPRKPRLDRFPFTWFPFNLLRGMILFLQDLYRMVRTHVQRSIRLQLMLTFAFCFGVSLLFYGISSALFGAVNKNTVIDYSQGMESIDSEARSLADRFLMPPRRSSSENGTNNESPSYDSNAASRSESGQPQAAVPQGSAAGSGMPTPNAGTAVPVPGANGQEPGSVPGTPAANPQVPQPNQPNNRQGENKQDEAERRKNFENTVKRLVTYNKLKIVITDLEGKVVFRSENAPETYVDVHSVIRNAMETRNRESDSRSEFSSFYPVTYNNQKAYLIVSGIPQPTISYHKGENPLSILASLAVFIFLFYFLTQRKMRYIEELASGLRIIATGNLDHRVVERSQDELGSLARDMNFMVTDLQRRIEEERRAEQLKNELITNVSHDLRTPLTLIMGYLRLLHDRNFETPEQAAGYVSIAYSKSEKLKGLIDDLFEFTKLSNHDAPLHKKGVVINEVLEQLLEEYVTLSEEQQLTLIRSLPQERLLVRIDVDKMIRVFENLLGNAIKYSPKPGVITFGMIQERGHAIIRISNKADALTRDELEQLFDRFYRVDKARTSDTGGSGLGLAIARSIVESHEGTIWAESENGEIHFYVKLKLAS